MKHEYPSLFDPSKNVEVWFCDEPCCNGKQLHRDDGPAVIYPDGTNEWWKHGKRLTDAEASSLQGELAANAMRKGLSRDVIAPAKATFGPKSRA
jgi:hypothetical protein